MTTLEISGLILTGELALVSWLILFLMLRRQRQHIHEDHAHAGAVIKHLEKDEVSRRDALASLFETTYRLEGEELASKVDEYVAREKAFYNAMLSLYLSRDGARLKEIPEQLAQVLTPWVEMTPSGMIHSSEVNELESEKTALAAELDSTKETLEQLMDEYMAAFKKSQVVDEQDETPAEEPSAPEAPRPALEPDPMLDTEEPAASVFDEADLDIMSEPEEMAELEEIPTEAIELPSQPDQTETSEPPPPEPAATAEPEEADAPIDQETLDAMLSAFSLDNQAEPAVDETEPATDSLDSPSEQATQEDDDEMARKELEGLADLFGDLDEKP